MNPTPEPRIGDAERDAAVRALGEHYAAGRLTKEEYDERADTALRARTNSDLRPLFVDLPRGQGQFWGQPTTQTWGAADPSAGRRGAAHQPGRRGAPPAVWMAAPLLVPVLLGLAVLLTAVSGAWWLIFFACWFFWWGPHRYRRGPWGR